EQQINADRRSWGRTGSGIGFPSGAAGLGHRLGFALVTAGLVCGIAVSLFLLVRTHHSSLIAPLPPHPAAPTPPTVAADRAIPAGGRDASPAKQFSPVHRRWVEAPSPP